MTLNDLEWLFHVKIRFRPALLESERLNVKNNTTSAILCIARSVSQPRHAQLTRCFSAVAELLVSACEVLPSMLQRCRRRYTHFRCNCNCLQETITTTDLGPCW